MEKRTKYDVHDIYHYIILYSPPPKKKTKKRKKKNHNYQLTKRHLTQPQITTNGEPYNIYYSILYSAPPPPSTPNPPTPQIKKITQLS